jgi:hypothetical protein
MYSHLSPPFDSAAAFCAHCLDRYALAPFVSRIVSSPSAAVDQDAFVRLLGEMEPGMCSVYGAEAVVRALTPALEAMCTLIDSPCGLNLIWVAARTGGVARATAENRLGMWLQSALRALRAVRVASEHVRAAHMRLQLDDDSRAVLAAAVPASSAAAGSLPGARCPTSMKV